MRIAGKINLVEIADPEVEEDVLILRQILRLLVDQVIDEVLWIRASRSWTVFLLIAPRGLCDVVHSEVVGAQLAETGRFPLGRIGKTAILDGSAKSLVWKALDGKHIPVDITVLVTGREKRVSGARIHWEIVLVHFRDHDSRILPEKIDPWTGYGSSEIVGHLLCEGPLEKSRKTTTRQQLRQIGRVCLESRRGNFVHATGSERFKAVIE